MRRSSAGRRYNLPANTKGCAGTIIHSAQTTHPNVRMNGSTLQITTIEGSTVIMGLIIPKYRVLYADSYNIAFFHDKRDAKRFEKTKRLAKTEVAP